MSEESEKVFLPLRLVIGALITMTCTARTTIGLSPLYYDNHNAEMRLDGSRSGSFVSIVTYLLVRTQKVAGSAFVRSYLRSLRQIIQDGESDCFDAYCNMTLCALLCFFCFQFHEFSMDRMD